MKLHTFLAFSPLLVAGCRGCAPSGGAAADAPGPSTSAIPSVAPLTAEERRGAEETVVSYYAAISLKDCAEMNKLSFKPHTAKECDKIIEDYTEHATQLVSVEEVKRDGRDPNAVIVKLILRFKNADHPTLARAVRVGADWKVR